MVAGLSQRRIKCCRLKQAGPVRGPPRGSRSRPPEALEVLELILRVGAGHVYARGAEADQPAVLLQADLLGQPALAVEDVVERRGARGLRPLHPELAAG